MSEKIFISYNHQDEILVDTITRRLAIEFGNNNIFYDRWSIQPGDSIIGKMDSGLSEFTTFFFFVSQNSLKSKMVELEWQTALNRAVNNNLKFVAVRIADCSMPTILSDKLYIDLYGEGLDSAIEKMRSVIKGENVYKPFKDIENVVAFVNQNNIYDIYISIEATHFVVHNPIIAVTLTASNNQFKIKQKSEVMFVSGKEIISTNNGIEFIGERFILQRPLVPGKPFIVNIKLDESIGRITLGIFIGNGKTNNGLNIYDCVPCINK